MKARTGIIRPHQNVWPAKPFMAWLGPTTRAAPGVDSMEKKCAALAQPVVRIVSSFKQLFTIWPVCLHCIYMVLPAYAPSLTLQNRRDSLIKSFTYCRRHSNLRAAWQLCDIAKGRIKIFFELLYFNNLLESETMKIQLIRIFLLI